MSKCRQVLFTVLLENSDMDARHLEELLAEAIEGEPALIDGRPITVKVEPVMVVEDGDRRKGR